MTPKGQQGHPRASRAPWSLRRALQPKRARQQPQPPTSACGPCRWRCPVPRPCTAWNKGGLKRWLESRWSIWHMIRRWRIKWLACQARTGTVHALHRGVGYPLTPGRWRHAPPRPWRQRHALRQQTPPRRGPRLGQQRVGRRHKCVSNVKNAISRSWPPAPQNANKGPMDPCCLAGHLDKMPHPHHQSAARPPSRPPFPRPPLRLRFPAALRPAGGVVSVGGSNDRFCLQVLISCPFKMRRAA